MTYEQFWSIMIFIFSENFFLTGATCIVMLLVLIAKRFFRPTIPYRLAFGCWLLLVIGGISAAIIALLGLPGQGADQSHLAILVYIFGASPLMICAAIAIFLFPRSPQKSGA